MVLKPTALCFSVKRKAECTGRQQVDGHVLALARGDYALVYIRIIVGGSRASFGTRGRL